MEPIDHSQTMVLIIGVSEYPEDKSIPAIPNILANIQLLKDSLVNPDVVGIPESNIVVSINESKSKIEKKLKQVADGSTKSSTMVVYYSGHGIYSPSDFQLYFTTNQTTRNDLEIDGINIDVFKSRIRKARAARKIVILDCCHSGAFIGAMGDVVSQIQSNVNGFEGTYVMTSAAEDEPSLYPVKSPDRPTYFTGKLIEIINQGLDNHCEYCSLRDLYNQIETDFRNEGLPTPQQSNFNKADQLLFWKNKQFTQKKSEEEIAWEEALEQNNKWAYLDFRNLYPGGQYDKLAKQKIRELEEDDDWQTALRISTVFSFTDYLDKYPDGKHAEEVNQRINDLRSQDALAEEKRMWAKVSHLNDVDAYRSYLRKYPAGRFVEVCKAKIDGLAELKSKREAVEKKKAFDEQEADRVQEENRKKEQDRLAQKRKAEIEAEQRRAEEERKEAERHETLKLEQQSKRGGLIIAETPYGDHHTSITPRKIAIIGGIVAGVILLIKVIVTISS